MRSHAVRLAFLLAASLFFGASALAGELDHENPPSIEQAQLAKGLPQTLVVRSRPGSNEKEVLNTRHALPANASAAAVIAKGNFTKLTSRGITGRGELDRGGSTSSWYLVWPSSYSYYYPTYYYYGYSYPYTPYYNYFYGGYNYWYYSWGW